MDYSIARKYALRLLSMRDYHSAVFRRKLEKKGFTAKICDQVMQDCRRLGFFKDDEAILRELRRGYGPKLIEFKLQLPREDVRRVITRELQRERIIELALKLKEKALRTLLRKGFDSELVFDVLAQAQDHEFNM